MKWIIILLAFIGSWEQMKAQQNPIILNEKMCIRDSLKMDTQKALQAPENVNDSILVKIAPEITLPEGRTRNDLSFEWRIRTERDYSTIWDIYSTSDTPVSYTHLDVYKRQPLKEETGHCATNCMSAATSLQAL